MRPSAPTADQRRAIETAGRDLCVVAGAGSGKTFVLTERVVGRVLSGEVSLLQVLAITFTEKAAAELKDRLGRALLARGRATAREDVDAAAVSTIHSFCARVLRENAIEAGVDPSFEVLDEVAAERCLRAALDALVEETAAEDPAGLSLLASLGGEKGDPAATLLDVAAAAKSSGLPVGEFVRRVPEMPASAEVARGFRDALDALDAIKASAPGCTPAAKARAADVLAAAERLPGDDAPVRDRLTAVAAVVAAVKLNCGAPVKELLAAVRETGRLLLSLLAEEALVPVRERLARAVERLEELHEAAKGSGRRLDFDDLERRVLTLLETRGDVASRLRARRPEVLVDEAQDVNPVQARLLDFLRTPGRLFTVGDPKQSIYGFRGADVAVFEDRIRDASAADREGLVTLRHSFRSRPEVLGFVNQLFADGVGRDSGAASDVRLAAARPWAPAAAPCVEVAAFPAEGMDEGRRWEAAWIADRILALTDGSFRIAAPTDTDPQATRPASFDDVAVLLRATTHLKTLEEALVARDVPYAVVKGRGFFVAREVVDLANLLACVENPRDDLTLAAVLRSPAAGISDDALFAFCAAREKGRVLSDVLEGWCAGTSTVADLPPEDAAVAARFADVLRDLRARRAATPLGDLVERAVAATRLDLLALGRPNGRQRAANLRKVRSLARAAEAAGSGLLNFVAELRDLRDREVREAEAPLAASGAVKILTVHAAKGLEFPVVFVPDVGRQAFSTKPRAITHSALGLGLRGPASAGMIEPCGYEVVRDRVAEREEAESDRLLYVAVTRAADHLVLSGAISSRKAERPWWDRIAKAVGLSGPPAESFDADVGPCAESLGPAGRVLVRVHAHRREEDPAPITPRTLLPRLARDLADGRVPERPVPGEAAAAAEQLVAEAARRAPEPDGTPYATTVSALLAFDRCPQEYRLRHVLGLPESLDLALSREPAAFAAESADGTIGAEAGAVPAGERPGDEDELAEAHSPAGARAVGRAVHAALERLVPEFSEDASAVVAESLRAETGGAAPDPAEISRLVGWIERFRDSAEGRVVRSVPRDAVRREQAFLLAAGPTFVRGQIDLLWSAAGGTVVLDYKAADLAAPRREHVLQMRLYGLAARAFGGGVPPPRLVLFSLPRGRAIEVPCTEGDLGELQRGLVAEFLDRTRRRDFAPRADPPCAACAFRDSCGFSR